jgi:hypothetical protein
MTGILARVWVKIDDTFTTHTSMHTFFQGPVST